ncbi:restriction endonuclease subunit S [Trinickia symbiotica]
MPLADIARHVTSGGTPTSGSPRYYTEHNGIPFAKTEDLTRARSKYLEQCELQITASALKESAAKRYPIGTILVSMYGTIGATKVTACELAANQALCALIPPFSCHPDYLYHHLEYIRPDWVRFSGQTTQANINGATVRARRIPLPNASEQRKIAQILDTLATAIRETDAIIDKLKLVKQGLLHDLLTRGVDENGELRLPPSEAPHLYKESPLGWIPNEWGVLNLGDVAAINSGVTLGRSLTGHGAIELPYLRVANVQDGYVDLSDIKTVVVLRDEIERFALADGDVLMNEGGDYDKLGRGTVWRAQINPCLHQNHVFRVRCNREVLVPDYLAAYSASPRGKAFFVLSSKQSTNLASINSTQLKAFPIECPSLPEQYRIMEKLDSVDGRVSSEQSELQKLRAFKSALMDDLLTGRVRVTPLLEQQ